MRVDALPICRVLYIITLHVECYMYAVPKHHVQEYASTGHNTLAMPLQL